MDCASCEAMLMLPVLAAIRPLLTILDANRFTEFIACITGVPAETPAGSALTIAPPALTVRSPALLMVPELTMLLTAFKSRLKLPTRLLKPGKPDPGKTVESSAPGRLIMLLAARLATVTAGSDDTANTRTLFTRSPASVALSALLKSITAVGRLDTLKVSRELTAEASRTSIPRLTVRSAVPACSRARAAPGVLINKKAKQTAAAHSRLAIVDMG